MGWKRNTYVGKRRHDDVDGPTGRTEQREYTPPTEKRERIEPDLIDEYIRKHGVKKIPPQK